MAIAFDAASNGRATNTNTITVSHTCTGSNEVLVVGVAIQLSTGFGGVNGVTYNGVSCTLIDFYDVSGTREISLWYLKNPANGTHDIVATLDVSHDEIQLAAATWTGVHQTTAIGTAAKAHDTTGTSNGPITVDVSSASGELVVDFASPFFALGVPSVGLNQTKRSENDATGSSGSWVGISQENGAGTVTMSWTLAFQPRNWATIAVPLKPASSGFTLAADAGSYALTGTVAITRIGSTTYLRYRK